MNNFHKCTECGAPRAAWARWCENCLGKINREIGIEPKVQQTAPVPPPAPVSEPEPFLGSREARIRAISRTLTKKEIVDRVLEYEKSTVINELGPIVCSQNVIVASGTVKHVELKTSSNPRLVMKGLAIFGDDLSGIYIKRIESYGMGQIVEGYDDLHAVPAVAFRVPLRVIPVEFDYQYGIQFEVEGRGAYSSYIDITAYCDVP